MRAFQRANRDAFTLIELLVVITIGITLSAMAVMVIPKFNENRIASKAADQLQGWLLISKTKALRDGAPRGIRITYDTNKLSAQIQFVEQPPNLTPRVSNAGVLSTPAARVYNQASGTPPVDQQQFVAIEDIDLLSTASIALNDLIVFPDDPTGNYLITKVYSKSQPGSLSSDAADLNTYISTKTNWTVVQLQTRMNSAAYTTFSTTNYRFVRQPQPLLGETGMSLPVDTTIDLSDADNKIGSGANTTLGTVGGTLDILFAPSGLTSVFKNGNFLANQGRIIIEVRHQDPNVGEATLLTIYSRTGSIAAHPVDPGSDRYALTKDGMNSGM
jgi:type II secretory pathway pseudopilin PulG